MLHHKSNSSSPQDQAQQLIADLKQYYADKLHELDKANEAKTRLVLINTVLNALGWKNEDFNPETKTGSTSFIDYLLTIDGVPRIIVEAKRAGTTFRSTRNKLKNTEYKLSYLRSQFGNALTEVIEQAGQYAEEQGIDFAVITNGMEWLIVQLRVPPGYNGIDDLQAHYFGNLLTDDFYFDPFWALLSRDSVTEGNLEEQFANLNTVPVDWHATPRDELSELKWQKVSEEDIEDTYLQEFYRRFFQDITDPARRRMLEKCFVSDDRLDQYQGELKRALKDTVPNYIQGEELSPSSTNWLNAESGDRRGAVIIVTGSVGCGKSTFVAKILIEARQEEIASSPNRIYLSVDLINELNIPSATIPNTLWKRLQEAWLDRAPDSDTYTTLKKIFGLELKRLKVGPSARIFQQDENEYLRREAETLEELRTNPEAFVKGCCRYHKTRGEGIAVFFDNVDRASEEYQQQVYVLAHQLAADTGITVIITMRESTFFRGQMGGFLDVRPNDRVLHLRSPNLEQIIAQRVNYVEEYIDDDIRAKKTWKKGENWHEFRETSLRHAEILKETFLKDSAKGRAILSILASISWHNVRHFLEILQTLHLQLGSSNKSWSQSEAIAALLIPAETYRPHSLIPNVFRPPFPNYRCYFLKLRIILYLIFSVREGERSSGVSGERILRFARHYGYERRWTERAIEELVQGRLLECLEIPAEQGYQQKEYKLAISQTFRRSPLAVTVVEQIISNPMYLCVLGNDLPFHQSTAYKNYLKALKTVLEIADDGRIERNIIALITEDQTLAQVTALYLTEAFKYEQPSDTMLKHQPEVMATEQRLEELLGKVRKIASIDIPSTIEEISSLSTLPLFNLDNNQDDQLVIKQLPIPENIHEVQVSKSVLGSLIFWAMVALRLIGRHSVTGAEITRIINEYLTSEYDKKEHTNVSRALRRPVLQEQKWLVTEPSTYGPRYSLTDDWPYWWEQIYGQPAPSNSPPT